MKKQKAKIFKILLLIMVIAILVIATIYLFPLVSNLATPEGQIEFKNKIQNTGILGILLLFGLQFAQIFLFIIPGEPIEILAGMCFGGFYGTIFILVSCFIISTIIVSLVRKFGLRFVENFFEKKQIKKFKNSKLFKNPKTIEIIMCILFLIPGTPKDLLTFLGGILPINPLKFILISTFARIPSVVSSTYAGNSILNGDIKTSILIYLITFILVAIFLLIYNKFDRSKVTEKVLNDVMKKEEETKK